MTDHAHPATAGHADSHGAALHDPSAHGAEASHHGGLSYVQVFMILLVVTILEVGLAYMDVNKSLKIVTFVAMALYKAIMVAAYFMHLKFEKKGMWLIAAVPLIIGPLIAVGTFPDSEKGLKSFKRGELHPWEAPAESPAPHQSGPEAPLPAKH